MKEAQLILEGKEIEPLNVIPKVKPRKNKMVDQFI